MSIHADLKAASGYPPALEATEREGAQHPRASSFISLNCAGVPKGFTMVANHAQKKIARQIIANSNYPVSFTEAMAHAEKIDSLRGIRLLELPAESKRMVDEASRALIGGRELVIFGLTGSGKSTAVYSILQELQLRSAILASHYLEAAMLRSYLSVSGVDSIVQSQHHFSGSVPTRAEVLVVDELLNSFAGQGAQLSTVMPKIIVVHGRDVANARFRIGYIMPELELRSPVFLEAVYDQKSRTRGLRIHDNSSSDPNAAERL